MAKAFAEKKAEAARAREAREIAAEKAKEEKAKEAREMAAKKAKEEARAAAAREREAAKLREEKLRAAKEAREKEEREEEARERARVRNMTPAQREKEARRIRRAKLAEKELKKHAGETVGVLAASAGTLLGNLSAAVMVGLAFGAGSYLAVKGATVTARALTHRRRGGDTPKPPRAPRGGDGKKSGATTPKSTNSSTIHSPKSPSLEDDLDDVDLVSPLNTTRSGEDVHSSKPPPRRKPPGVPSLPLFRIFGGPSPPASGKEPPTERRDKTPKVERTRAPRRTTPRRSVVVVGTSSNRPSRRRLRRMRRN